jgi:predicted DNA-binding protein
MVSQRLEVRLDPEMREKLEKLAEVRSLTISEAVREAIDKAYEEVMHQKRRDAARRIGDMEIEDVPDMATLKKQLSETYEPRIP